MSLSDEEFREVYKPITVPHRYNTTGTDMDKVMYALGQIGKGTAEVVCGYLAKIDKNIDKEGYLPVASAILQGLFDGGHIKATIISDQMVYDLSKITQANEGSVNPELLAPGLD